MGPARTVRPLPARGPTGTSDPPTAGARGNPVPASACPARAEARSWTAASGARGNPVPAAACYPGARGNPVPAAASVPGELGNHAPAAVDARWSPPIGPPTAVCPPGAAGSMTTASEAREDLVLEPLPPFPASRGIIPQPPPVALVRGGGEFQPPLTRGGTQFPPPSAHSGRRPAVPPPRRLGNRSAAAPQWPRARPVSRGCRASCACP